MFLTPLIFYLIKFLFVSPITLFPYSLCRLDGKSMPMRVRSMVGLIRLYACLVLEDEVIKKLPGFRKRLEWFLANRQDLAKQVLLHLSILFIYLLIYFIIDILS